MRNGKRQAIVAVVLPVLGIAGPLIAAMLTPVNQLAFKKLLLEFSLWTDLALFVLTIFLVVRSFRRNKILGSIAIFLSILMIPWMYLLLLLEAFMGFS